MTPYHLFIGRWSPFHNGHVAVIEKKVAEDPKPILVLVRATDYDPWIPEVRAKMVRAWAESKNLEHRVYVIPDITGVYYGRGVGYRVEEVEVDEDVSGTGIRQAIEDNDDTWQLFVPLSTARVIQEHAA